MKIEIPDTIEIDGKKYVVKLIAADAFKDNTALESVTIPETIEQIGDSAFAGCTGLKDIYVQSPQPISLSVAAVRGVLMRAEGTAVTQFEGIDFDVCVLHVPYGSEQLMTSLLIKAA